MRLSNQSMFKMLSRLFYTGGTVILLVGLLLSMVNQPVNADAGAPTPEKRAPVGRGGLNLPTAKPNSDEPVNALPSVKEALEKKASGSNVEPAAPVNPGFVLQQGPLPEIWFLEEDQSICQFTPLELTVNVFYYLPAGMSARLQLTYYIVNPVTTPTTYIDGGVVSGEGIYTYSGLWPGVQPGDEVVEIHFGANLLDVETGEGIVDPTGTLDYYWYPWVCEFPTDTPTPTPTFTPTNTSVPTSTFTPTFTATNTNVPTSTFTPTFTATNTNVPTSTFTPTFTATNTNVPTSTFTPTFTATPTNTGEVTSTFTATPTNTLPVPPPDDPTITPTSTTVIVTNTPGASPTPTVTGTVPVPPPDNPTLTPTTDPGGGVLIPVTGADLGGGAAAGLLINIGLLFLGLGLILSGFSRRSTTTR